MVRRFGPAAPESVAVRTRQKLAGERLSRRHVGSDHHAVRASEAAQQALQTELNKPLMEALRESAEQDIFPAFKIVEMKPKTEEQPEETYPRFSPAKSPAKSPANETMQGQLPIPATMPPEQDHFQSGRTGRCSTPKRI